PAGSWRDPRWGDCTRRVAWVARRPAAQVPRYARDDGRRNFSPLARFITTVMADERLRIEAAQKDPSRFAELYEEHFERVYAYVLRRVCERSEAQDITADVFQQALANLPRFEWRGVPFAAWLYRIAANAVADHFQRTARQSSSPPGQEAAYG